MVDYEVNARETLEEMNKSIERISKEKALAIVQAGSVLAMAGGDITEFVPEKLAEKSKYWDQKLLILAWNEFKNSNAKNIYIESAMVLAVIGFRMITSTQESSVN